MSKPITQAEVRARIKGLPLHTKKAMVCALAGHSRVQTHCFGYFYCGRCEEQVGDSLASIYPQAAEVVIVAHDCKTCRANAKILIWRDTYLAPEPFHKAKAKGSA